MEKRRAITYHPGEKTEIYFGTFFFQKSIEQAGRGYEKLLYKRSNKSNEFDTSDISKEKNKIKEEKEMEGMIDEEKMKNKRKRKGSMKLRANTNFYEILGFEDWGEDFSLKKLKKNYMKMALKYHPDKLGSDYDEIAKQKWLKVKQFWDLKKLKCQITYIYSID